MTPSPTLFHRNNSSSPIAALLRNAIINLCKVSKIYDGWIEIDGIICISGQVEGQQLVVKVHESFRPQTNGRGGEGSEPFLENIETVSSRKRPRFDSKLDLTSSASTITGYDVSAENVGSSSRAYEVIGRNGVEDLSVKRQSHSSTESVTTPNNGSHEYTTYRNNGPTAGYRVDEFQSIDDSTSMIVGSPYRSRSSAATTSDKLDATKPTAAECRACGCDFDNSEALSDHNEAMHSLFTCLCCFKTFTSRSNLERHSRLHTGHKPYICGICGKAFSRKDHLSNHATKHAFKCSTCSKRYADQDSLISHYRLDHSASLTNICSYCNKGFSSQESYEDHVKIHPQFHLSTPTHPDETIGYRQEPTVEYTPKSGRHARSKQPGLIALNKLRAMEKLQALYTCLVCSQTFDHPWQYSSHLLMHSTESNAFKCSMCLQVCGTLAQLRQHESLHFGELSDYLRNGNFGSFACNRCDQTFDNLFYLQIHLDGHTRVNQAGLQKRPTPTPYGEVRHLGVLQFDDRPGVNYVCFRCNTHFLDHESLRKHMQETDHGQTADEDTKTLKRDKRKQTQPKPVFVTDEIRDNDSDVDVVESRSPERRGQERIASPKRRHASETNQELDFEQSRREPHQEIRLEPVRKLMNRPLLMTYGGDSGQGSRSSPVPRVGLSEKDEFIVHTREVMATNDNEVSRSEKVAADASDAGQFFAEDDRTKYVGINAFEHGSVFQTSGGTWTLDPRRMSGEYQSSSPHSDLGSQNNNISGLRNENSPPSGANSYSSGPYLCAFCDLKSDTFLELDTHCQTEHSRSPCMFCAKTFAQKANRDRHHCLHTGDKPYNCPDCEERFSRGDKLKMHRIRAHGVQFPAYGSRQKDSTPTREGGLSSSPGLLSPYEVFYHRAFLNGSLVSEPDGQHEGHGADEEKRIPLVVDTISKGDYSDDGEHNRSSKAKQLPSCESRPEQDLA